MQMAKTASKTKPTHNQGLDEEAEEEDAAVSFDGTTTLPLMVSTHKVPVHVHCTAGQAAMVVKSVHRAEHEDEVAFQKHSDDGQVNSVVKGVQGT